MADEQKDQIGPEAAYVENPFFDELCATAKAIGSPGKGILAADESTGTIGKRLAMISVENTQPNRRRYRELLFRSADIGQYISGCIMYEETLFDKAQNGTPLVELLVQAGVIPGIKVDKGARALPFKPGEKFTQGLTDLDIRAKQYYEQGARFAKWRAVLVIQNGYISETAIKENAWALARYAATCQANGLVPIVEPEILMDGDHPIEICYYWTKKVLSACYKALNDQEVLLEGTLLKPNMVLAGKQWQGARNIEKNAQYTVRALKNCVPSAVPAITFLSGGQSEEEATMNLNAINKDKSLAWSCTFSYGRALQQSCLRAWKGDDANIIAAQDAFLLRAKANSQAQLGQYTGDAATEDSKKSLYEKGYVY